MGMNAVPPLSFWNRAGNILIYGISIFIYKSKMINSIKQASEKYIRKDFDLGMRFQEASIIFLNMDEFLEFPVRDSPKECDS